MDRTGWLTPWETNFRQHMKRLRELKQMTQTDLAKELKLRGLAFHQQTIQRLESGERPIRLDEAFLIASALDSHVEEMIQSPNALLADLHYAVSRIERDSEQVGSELFVLFEDWIDAYNDLANAFDDLVKLSREQPTREVRWAAAWVLKANWVLESLNETASLANGLDSGAAENWREIPLPIVSELSDLEWSGVPENELPSALAELSPRELNAYLDGSSPLGSEKGISMTPVDTLKSMTPMAEDATFTSVE